MFSTILLSALAAAATPFPDGSPRYWPQFGGNRDVKLLDGQWDFGQVTNSKNKKRHNKLFLLLLLILFQERGV